MKPQDTPPQETSPTFLRYKTFVYTLFLLVWFGPVSLVLAGVLFSLCFGSQPLGNILAQSLSQIVQELTALMQDLHPTEPEVLGGRLTAPMKWFKTL